ncbi:MAG: LysM peptidoglycan-binding domain-containing protein [Betaproteobacteria bacterium]|jgi:hypothetical protein|nr:MAG: LysM peptidoglycan-binding domain-containing protein [Betaproteobacteria bacterium]
MGKRLIFMVLSTVAVVLVPGLMMAQDTQPPEPPALVENPPSRYVVVEGDTLWDISARFLRDPWRWPDIWGLNRDEVKNPHWIYPGDVLVLDFSGATPRLRFESDAGWTLVQRRLSPEVRKHPLDSSAIPTISPNLLKSFMDSTLIVDENQLDLAPTIIAGKEGRVLLGPGDVAYARGLANTMDKRHYAVRPGRTFTDPDTNEVLGYEAIYLGETRVRERADITTLKISRAIREINPGDRLLTASRKSDVPVMPRAPSRNINGKVIASANEGVSEIGPLTVVILNRGSRDGIENGNVLELSRAGEVVRPAGSHNRRETVTLPNERYGVVYVFKVYERLSYALVMHTTRSVKVNDFVLTPS